ncbi:MAG TPA: DUF929 family protein [Actinomycetota bacterium]|jgi:hypothetical protein
MTSRTAQKKKAGPAGRHPKAKPKARKRKGTQRRGRSPGLYAIGAVVAIVAVMVGYGVFNRAKTPDTPNATGASAVIDDVTSVPASALNAVGADGVETVPTALPPSTAAYEVDGKPAILYVGAEYCPYCAAERWALTIALSRFGSFDGLGLTTSSSTDIYPSTRTLSFHGSTFHSDLIAFDGVETATNELNAAGTSYQPLDTLTPEQQQLFQAYNSSGSIPFLLIGNRYVLSGSSFLPDVLQGKSWQEIASALQDPTSDVAKEVLASANVMTAAICELTDGEPANVCTSPGVQQGANALANA